MKTNNHFPIPDIRNGDFLSLHASFRIAFRIHFNILIKDCSGKNAMKGRNFIRIAVRDEKDNNALVNAMKKF